MKTTSVTTIPTSAVKMDIFCVLVTMIWIGVHDIVTNIFPSQIVDGSLIWKFRPDAAIKRLVRKYGSINAAIDELF